MKLVSRFDSARSPAFFTPWSIIHFLTGVFWALTERKLNLNKKYSFILFIIINILYETKDAFFTHGENSWQNSVADILSGVAGYFMVANTKLSIHQILSISVVLYIFFASPLCAKDGKTWSFGLSSWYNSD